MLRQCEECMILYLRTKREGLRIFTLHEEEYGRLKEKK